MDLHALLKRQLKRLGVDAVTGPPVVGAWHELLQRVSRAYEEFDQERCLLERSQDLASKETEELYAELRRERDLLDQRVHERTEALTMSERRLSSLLQLSAEWLWEQDEQLRFTLLCAGVEAAAGIHPQEMIGRKREIGESALVSLTELETYRACIEERRPFRGFTYRLKRRDGQYRFIRASGEPLHDTQGRFCGYHGVASDVTTAVLSEQKGAGAAALRQPDRTAQPEPVHR